MPQSLTMWLSSCAVALVDNGTTTAPIFPAAKSSSRCRCPASKWTLPTFDFTNQDSGIYEIRLTSVDDQYTGSGVTVAVLDHDPHRRDIGEVVDGLAGHDAAVRSRVEAVAVSRTLTVLSNGQGAGTVQSSPSGISCGGTCTASFADGTQVTLTATARPGSAFVRWNVAGCSGTEPCTMVMNADRSATATFTRVWEVVVRVTGSGSVTSRPTLRNEYPLPRLAL